MVRTKKSLATSAIALILCFSMLLGTTWAWFTDSAVSEGNVIQSGQLDAEMYWSDSFLPLDSDEWKNADGVPVFTYDNWEPGYTDIKYIKVKNAGNLSFKWRLTIEAESEVTELADVIDVYYVNPVDATLTSLNGLSSVGVLSDVIADRTAANGVLLPAGESSTEYTVGETVLAIAFHMQEDAGNKYQGDSVGDGFSLNLIATQFSYEEDEFGTSYDEDAEWPNTVIVGGSSASAAVTTTDGKVGSAVSMTSTDGSIKADVPAGVLLESGKTKLTLTVNDVEDSEANFSMSETEASFSIDVHIDGVAANNDVVMAISLKQLLPVGLNMGNYRFYHVEDGATVEMTLLADGATPVHNNYEYDPATGDVVLHLASFSEVALVADQENAWTGAFDYTWYTNAVAPVEDEAVTEYIIANADQLAAFGAIVGGMDGQTQDNFAGKTVKLVADINLGDKESENNPDIIFYPIGYYNSTGSYEKVSGGSVTSSVSSFEGTFDGNGHTIANFYQNTWEMFGDYNSGYSGTPNHYDDAMGLFGYVNGGTVKNLTVDNFSSDGEFTPTGVIAAYADGNATFENIAITNCNPRVYNTGNGGIIGIAGDTSAANDDHITLKNITVDNSNKISALWGSWDVACGGLVGMYRGNVDGSGNGTGDTISFENCHVSAIIDVYNDVCANYQYYAYRYAGMMIGSVRHNTINEEGRTIPNMTGISATGCTVNYGDWNDYYYCEFEKNTMASYSEDYQFSRVPHSELNFTDANGNGVVDANERASVTGCKHTHTAEENHQAIYLPFHQLFTGYSWGVSSIGLEKYSGIVTNLDITEGDQEESVEKFEVIKSDLTNNRVYKLGAIFNYLEECDVELVPSALTITVTNLDENGNVIAKIDYNREDWENGTIVFENTGKVKITIQDYYFCTPTEFEVTITERQHEEKFDVVMNNGDFLHRVGNSGTVAFDRLFKAKDGAEIGTVSVTVEAVKGNASGTYSNNSIQFSGTGIVTVTVTDNDYCIPTELTLEVVDAVNATTATSAMKNNVVLLQDCGFSSLEVLGGYTLYGNGFTMTCGSDSAALDMGYAFVTLNNGTLDNVQIVCPNFDYAVLYKSNMTESGNRSETTDKTRYYNVKSGVMASGNSQILNSRISGGRAAVNVSGGNVVIDNSRIELGAVASLLVGAANGVTLKDVTLVQKPTASTYDSSKTLMGFSALFVCDANGDATPVTLEGTLVQNAWVDENDKQYVPSAGQSIISTVLSKTEYLHDLDGDGEKESLNLGFAYMPESLTSAVNATTITDNRTNKDTIPYDYAEVSILNGKTYVYSYKNTNGTADSFKTESDYVPNKYSDIITVNYSDTADGLTTGKSYGTDGWVYELNVDLDKLSGYALDFSKLSMSVNGVTVTDFKVNGSAKPTSPVAVVAGGTTYTLTATINGKECTAVYKVTGTETSKESPSLVASNYEAGLCVASSYGGTWHGAAPALEGIQIKYWSVAEKQYKTINLSDYTPATKGQLNGTNTTWTYSPDNGDFTLTLTGGQVHSGNSVYAMPVVCDGKLYFVAASSKGLVNSGNSARTIPVSYSFKDNNNGDVLTFSHTWSVAENQDAQYKYSDFCNGTLTQLEAGSSSGGGCVTPETLITLADGTQKPVNQLTATDELLVWNMETGMLDQAPIMFVDMEDEAEFNVVTLTFSDGSTVDVIYEHGFWDYDLNKYVYLDENAADYIGHTFAKHNGDALAKVELREVTIATKTTEAWSPVTVGHLCYFVNGMLSMPGGVDGLFNFFEVDPETMKYDEEAMQKDIETYGLYTYEEMYEICPLTEEMFEAAGGAYLKVSVGKGLLTEDDLVYMITRYSIYLNLLNS